MISYLLYTSKYELHYSTQNFVVALVNPPPPTFENGASQLIKEYV